MRVMMVVGYAGLRYGRHRISMSRETSFGQHQQISHHPLPPSSDTSFGLVSEHFRQLRITALSDAIALSFIPRWAVLADPRLSSAPARPALRTHQAST